MPSNLFPFGVRLTDPQDIALNSSAFLASGLNQAGGTIPANQITGGAYVFTFNINASPGTLTTRTAAQLYADDPTSYPGKQYILRIGNSGAGTATLASGTGVSIVGTATVATATFRDFLVQIGGTAAAPTYTITNIGLGTYS